jgi:hypothetical protein
VTGRHLPAGAAAVARETFLHEVLEGCRVLVDVLAPTLPDRRPEFELGWRAGIRWIVNDALDKVHARLVELEVEGNA